MRVLVACEFSGVVRDAFLAQGADAFSCDLLPALVGDLWVSNHPRHIRCDVRSILPGYAGQQWDLMVAHPPCTYLSLSGNRHYADRVGPSLEALDFVRVLWQAPIPRICIENPKSIIHTEMTPYSQVIHPWMFGDPYQKETWLWLKNLRNLKPFVTTKPAGVTVRKTKGRYFRGQQRSVSYPGIAAAMSKQWLGPT